MNIVFHKDGFYSKDDVKLTPSNRAFRYADGCFEAIRVVNGLPVFWKLHYQRLRNTLTVLSIDFNLSENDLKRIVSELIHDNGVTGGAMIRLIAYRDGEGKYFPESNNAVLFLELLPVDSQEYPIPVIEKRASTFDKLRLPSGELGNHKVLNRTIHISAAVHAQKRREDEALILNENDHIAEAISSNAYFVFKNEIVTAPLSDGGLNGTMRKVLFENRDKLPLNLVERSIKANELADVLEIWTSNAGSGLSAIKQYEGNVLSTTQATEAQELLRSWALNSVQGFLGTAP